MSLRLPSPPTPRARIGDSAFFAAARPRAYRLRPLPDAEAKRLPSDFPKFSKKTDPLFHRLISVSDELLIDNAIQRPWSAGRRDPRQFLMTIKFRDGGAPPSWFTDRYQ